MRKLLLILILVLLPRLSYSQPATPCIPNNGSWTVGTSSVQFYVCSSDGLTWLTVNSSIPSGLVTLIYSGTCPTGWTEVSELNGKTLIGTISANKDVGTTGGNDTITSVINHSHTLATGTGTTGNFSQVIGTVDTSSGGNGGTPTQTSLGTLTSSTVNGVASIDNRSAFVKVIFCRKT